jgi:hypothetical protein
MYVIIIFCAWVSTYVTLLWVNAANNIFCQDIFLQNHNIGPILRDRRRFTWCLLSPFSVGKKSWQSSQANQETATWSLLGEIVELTYSNKQKRPSPLSPLASFKVYLHSPTDGGMSHDTTQKSRVNHTFCELCCITSCIGSDKFINICRIV